MENIKKPVDYADAVISTMMRKYAATELPPAGWFTYHHGVFFDGVYRNYLLTKEKKYFQYMKDWIDFLLDENGNITGRFAANLDDVEAGNLLFPLWMATGEEKYKKTLDFLMDVMKEYPKNKDGGFWHKKDCQNQMWLDGLYMAGPFLANYAGTFEQPEYYDTAIEQILLMHEKMADEKTGLWYHAYDQDRVQEWADAETGLSKEFWGRSLGWVPVAILEVLEQFPEEHPEFEKVVHILQELLKAVCHFQSDEGRWYQVVDKGGEAGNWLENSCSCLFVAAICKAVRKGLLDRDYLKQAYKGYESVIKSLEWDGEEVLIGNICIGTGVGDYKYYCERPTCVNDLHGVGAFLIMCAEVQQVM